jgi:hypothetical protein
LALYFEVITDTIQIANLKEELGVFLTSGATAEFCAFLRTKAHESERCRGQDSNSRGTEVRQYSRANFPEVDEIFDKVGNRG